MPKQKHLRSRRSVHFHPYHGYMFAFLGPPDGPVGTFLGWLASLHIHLYVGVRSRLRTPQEGRAKRLWTTFPHHMGHIYRVGPLWSEQAVLWVHTVRRGASYTHFSV
jgi:hypothetical protein